MGVECSTSMKRTEGFHKWLLVILRFKVQLDLEVNALPEYVLSPVRREKTRPTVKRLKSHTTIV